MILMSVRCNVDLSYLSYILYTINTYTKTASTTAVSEVEYKWVVNSLIGYVEDSFAIVHILDSSLDFYKGGYVLTHISVLSGGTVLLTYGLE